MPDQERVSPRQPRARAVPVTVTHRPADRAQAPAGHPAAAPASASCAGPEDSSPGRRAGLGLRETQNAAGVGGGEQGFKLRLCPSKVHASIQRGFCLREVFFLMHRGMNPPPFQIFPRKKTRPLPLPNDGQRLFFSRTTLHGPGSRHTTRQV